MVELKLLIMNEKPSAYAEVVIMLHVQPFTTIFEGILPERLACVGVGRPVYSKSLHRLQYFYNPTFLAIVLGCARYPCHFRFPPVPGYRPGGPLFFYTGNEGTTVMGHGWPKALPSMGGRNQWTQHGELTSNCEHNIPIKQRGWTRINATNNHLFSTSNTRMWPTHPCRELWVCS